jgi:protein tyrosine/serine phosphatase
MEPITTHPKTVRANGSSTVRKRLALAAALLLAAIVAVNHEQVTALRDRFIPKRWGVVVEGKIYRSGQISQYLVKEVLRAHRIQTVVDLTFDNPEDVNHQAEIAAIAELGIARKLCPLDSDGTGDAHIYAQAVAVVAASARQDKPVLVHCVAGAQRTGGVVALYRLLVEGQSPANVLQEMQKYKYDPRRSPRLQEYLNSHIAEIAEDLVRDGTIERVPSPLPKLGG